MVSGGMCLPSCCTYSSTSVRTELPDPVAKAPADGPRRLRRLAAASCLLALALLVAWRPRAEPPRDRGLVAVSVALTGGPRTSDGALLATAVVLRVADETGRAVRFDCAGSQRRTGGPAELLLG